MRTEETAAPPYVRLARTSPAALLVRVYLSWLPILLVAFGVAVRARQYFFHRSLWLDEAKISLILVGRSYRGLLSPLGSALAAPLGWLWAERAAIDLLGPSEYGLRLVPLLAGIATLLAFWWAARRLLDAWLVPLALALAAVSPRLLYYSNEAKQYESDAAIGLVLLIASLPLLEERPGWRPMLFWAGLGAVAVWCSHPAVLLLAGYSAAVAGRHLLRRNWATLARLAAVSLLWGLSFLAVYAVSLRAAGRNRVLNAYWREGFLPQPLHPKPAVRWLGGRWVEFVDDPLGLSPLVIVTILLVLGCVALLLRRRAQAVLLLSPLPVFVGAATIHAYPIKSRLLLVLVPTVLLVAAAAPAWHQGRAALFTRGLGVVLLGMVLVGPAGEAVALVRHPTTLSELRPVLEEIKVRRQPGEKIWAHTHGREIFRYYEPIVGLKRDATVGFGRSRTPCDDRSSIERASKGGRVWLVLAYQATFAQMDHAALLSRMDLAGIQVDVVDAPGAAAAYLYDLDQGPADPTGAHVRQPRPGIWCLKISASR